MPIECDVLVLTVSCLATRKRDKNHRKRATSWPHDTHTLRVADQTQSCSKNIYISDTHTHTTSVRRQQASQTQNNPNQTKSKLIETIVCFIKLKYQHRPFTQREREKVFLLAWTRTVEVPFDSFTIRETSLYVPLVFDKRTAPRSCAPPRPSECPRQTGNLISLSLVVDTRKTHTHIQSVASLLVVVVVAIVAGVVSLLLSARQSVVAAGACVIRLRVAERDNIQ